MIELVILDLYGTIWGSNKPQRNGLIDFLDKYRDRKFVVSTDDPDKDVVEQLISGLGISDRILRIYTEQDMVDVEGPYKTGKALSKICSDFKVTSDNAVFIGDGDRDMIDAKREGVSFVHVPYYQLHEEKFSFNMIDLDNLPGRYIDLRSVNSE